MENILKHNNKGAAIFHCISNLWAFGFSISPPPQDCTFILKARFSYLFHVDVS